MFFLQRTSRCVVLSYNTNKLGIAVVEHNNIFSQQFNYQLTHTALKKRRVTKTF